MRKCPTRRCGAPWTSAGLWSCSSSRTTVSSHQVSTAGSLGGGGLGGAYLLISPYPFSPSNLPLLPTAQATAAFQARYADIFPFQGLSAVEDPVRCARRSCSGHSLRTDPRELSPPSPGPPPLALLLPLSPSQPRQGPDPTSPGSDSGTAPSCPATASTPRAGAWTAWLGGAPPTLTTPLVPRQLPQAGGGSEEETEPTVPPSGHGQYVRWQEWGQDGASSPVNHLNSFPVGGEMRPAPLSTPSPNSSPCDRGRRGSGHSLPPSSPVHNLECVTFRPFHLYFMQNGLV